MEAFLVLVAFLFYLFGIPVLREFIEKFRFTSVTDAAIGGVADRRRALRRAENERRLEKETRALAEQRALEEQELRVETEKEALLNKERQEAEMLLLEEQKADIAQKIAEAAERKRREEKEAAERARKEKQERELKRDATVQVEPFEFNCFGHPNRTLALRYGILNQVKNSAGKLIENRTIKLRKKGHVKGFEKRGHYWAELVDFDNALVRVVIDDSADFISTFYPTTEREWFDKYEPLERVLKNAEAFSLEELAKYYLDVVVIPSLNQ